MAKSRSVALLAALVLGVAVAWLALRLVTHSPERLAETLAKDADPERRRTAAEALASANDGLSEEALAAAASDPDFGVRAAVRRALVARKSRRTVKAVAKSFAVLGPNEKLECVKALGESGDLDAVPVILHAARAQEIGQGRVECVVALEKLGNGAIDPLLEGLKDAHPNVRSVSAGGLGALAFRMRGTDAGKVPETFGKAVAPIAALLKDAEPTVRGSAADALGSLHLPEAVPALVNALGDPDPTVQVILPRVLSYFPAEAIDALIALLRHDDFPVRRSAAETLGEIALRGQGVVAVESPEGRAIAECEQGLKRRNAEFIAGAYLYYIRKGQAGAVLYLVDTMNTLGDKRMAEVYLNCGNTELAEAAKNWANDNGFTISTRHAGSGYKWGGK